MHVSVHLSYILGSLPFDERFAAARKLGFQAVAFPSPIRYRLTNMRDCSPKMGSYRSQSVLLRPTTKPGCPATP